MALIVKLNPSASEFAYYDSLSGLNLNLSNPLSTDLSSLASTQLLNVANAVNDGRLVVVAGQIPITPGTFAPIAVSGTMVDTSLSFDASGNLFVSAILNSQVTSGSILPAGSGSTQAQAIQGMPDGYPITVNAVSASFAGTVNAYIENFPTLQQVAGTVSVGNFPSSQLISGSLSLLDGGGSGRTVNVGPAGVLFTTTGGSSATSVSASSGTHVIKASGGRLCKVLVTGSGTGSGNLVFYDNASASSGTIIGIIPGTVSITGVPYIYDFPVANGITALQVNSGPVVSVSFY